MPTTQSKNKRKHSGPMAETAAVVSDTLRRGKLRNGVRYYIQPNAKPEDIVELRLIVNVGSLMEKEDERGLAHFVEHMGFKGTKSFKKYDLVRVLQSLGITYGPDLNASTHLLETKYNLSVHRNGADLSQLRLGIDVLKEWALHMTMQEADVVEERSVIASEYRAKKGLGERLLKKYWRSIFDETDAAGEPVPASSTAVAASAAASTGAPPAPPSLLANRMPIGIPEVFMTTGSAKMAAFYRQWYVPENISIVIVGAVGLGEGEEGEAELDAVVRALEEAFAEPGEEGTETARVMEEDPRQETASVENAENERSNRLSQGVAALSPLPTHHRRDVVVSMCDRELTATQLAVEFFSEWHPDARCSCPRTRAVDFVRWNILRRVVSSVIDSRFSVLCSRVHLLPPGITQMQQMQGQGQAQAAATGPGNGNNKLLKSVGISARELVRGLMCTGFTAMLQNCDSSSPGEGGANAATADGVDGEEAALKARQQRQFDHVRAALSALLLEMRRFTMWGVHAEELELAKQKWGQMFKHQRDHAAATVTSSYIATDLVEFVLNGESTVFASQRDEALLSLQCLEELSVDEVNGMLRTFDMHVEEGRSVHYAAGGKGEGERKYLGDGCTFRVLSGQFPLVKSAAAVASSPPDSPPLSTADSSGDEMRATSSDSTSSTCSEGSGSVAPGVPSGGMDDATLRRLLVEAREFVSQLPDADVVQWPRPTLISEDDVIRASQLAVGVAEVEPTDPQPATAAGTGTGTGAKSSKKRRMYRCLSGGDSGKGLLEPCPCCDPEKAAFSFLPQAMVAQAATATATAPPPQPSAAAAVMAPQSEACRVCGIPNLGSAHEMTLPNGITVAAKWMPQQLPGKLSMQGFALGGSTELSEAQETVFAMLDSVAAHSAIRVPLDGEEDEQKGGGGGEDAGAADDSDATPVPTPARSSTRFVFSGKDMGDLQSMTKTNVNMQRHLHHRGIGGSSPKDKLDLLLALLVLKFTAQSIDRVAFEDSLASQKDALKFRNNSPESVFMDRARVLTCGDHSVSRPVSMEVLNSPEVSVKIARELHKRAFLVDPTEFSFVFVGDLPPIEDFQRMLSNTLGRLQPNAALAQKLGGKWIRPQQSEGSSVPSHPFTRLPPHSIDATVHEKVNLRQNAVDDKASKLVAFRVDWPADEEEAVAIRTTAVMDVACRALQMDLLEELRVRLGKVYSVAVESSRHSLGSNSLISIVCHCDPEDVDLVGEAITNRLSAMQQERPEKRTAAIEAEGSEVAMKDCGSTDVSEAPPAPPSGGQGLEKDVSGIVEALLRSHKQALQHPSYWLFWILDSYKAYGVHRHYQMQRQKQKQELPTSAEWVGRHCHLRADGRAAMLQQYITPAAVREALRNHFRLDRAVHLDLCPILAEEAVRDASGVSTRTGAVARASSGAKADSAAVAVAVGGE